MTSWDSRRHFDSRTREGQVRPGELRKGSFLVRNWVTGGTYGIFSTRDAAERVASARRGLEVEVVPVTSDNFYELRRQLQDNLDCWPA